MSTFPTTTSSAPVAAAPSARWRLVALFVVAATMAVSVLAVVDVRRGGDLASSTAAGLDLDDVAVSISGIAAPDEITFSSLSLASSNASTAGQVSISDSRATLVAARSESAGLIGLAIVSPGRQGEAVAITPETTARALLALSPELLTPNLAVTLDNVNIIAADPSFEALVNAVAVQPTLTEPNSPVEEALAAILARVPVAEPRIDQGCDSIADTSAYPATGTCVRPLTETVEINNEQDRWALMFSGPSLTSPCAAIPPITRTVEPALITMQQCPGESLLVAPGPAVVPDGVDARVVADRITIASIFNSIDTWLLPFADLAGQRAPASSGFTAEIVDNPGPLVSNIDALLDSSSGLSSLANALGGGRLPPVERHVATISLSQEVIGSDQLLDTLKIPVAARNQLNSLLDLYDRTGQLIPEAEPVFRWDAAGAAAIDIGGE